MNLRILHSTSDWLGLTKSWIYDQVRFMPSTIDQTIFCGKKIAGKHLEWPVNVIEEGQMSNIYNKYALKINNISRSKVVPFISTVNFADFDILFSHFGSRAWYDYQRSPSLPVKRVVRFYGYDVGVTPRTKKWKDRYLRLFEKNSALIAEGPFMAQSLVELGAPIEKVKWIRLGIDPLFFEDRLECVYCRDVPMKVLIAATFTEKKGVDLALQGLLEFLSNNKVSIEITVVGDASSPEEVALKNKILNLITQLDNLSNSNANWLGYVSLGRLRSLMQKHHIFLSPSLTASNGDVEGGFPVVLTHAAANGMMLIGSDHCDLPIIVKEGYNGYICTQGNIGSFIQQLERLFSENPDNINKMRLNSMLLAGSEFNAVHTTKQLADLLVEII